MAREEKEGKVFGSLFGELHRCQKLHVQFSTQALPSYQHNSPGMAENTVSSSLLIFQWS